MLRPIKIRHYLSIMQAKGYSVESILAGSGINREMIDEPNFLLEVTQYKTIVSNIIESTGDKGIGLEIGGQFELKNLGIVGHLIMSAQSLREATNYAIIYGNSLVGRMIKEELKERAPDDWSIYISELLPLESVYSFCVEEQLAMSYRLAGKLTSVVPVVRQIELTYSAPSYQELYHQMFNVPIKFNAPRNCITFSSPNLDYPLLCNDKEFNQMCILQCEMLMRQIGQQSPFVSKVKSILMRHQPQTSSFEDIAHELNISSRTLSRHLKDEGYSYQQIVNGFRADLAKEYLRSLSITPKEIAYLLGFRNVNSFHRAFKLWTNQTITEYVGSHGQ